ncbi:MAG: phosphodiester glycosidase family protein, partial [Aphanizomenon sp.]
MTVTNISRRSFLFLGGASLAQGLFLSRPGYAQSVQINRSQFNGIPFYQTIVNLRDPKNLITIGLANNAGFANSIQRSSGDEEFGKLVGRYEAAVVANGTFFAKNPQKTVMGNMIAGGRSLKYISCENFCTFLRFGLGI